MIQVDCIKGIDAKVAQKEIKCKHIVYPKPL